MDGYKHYVRTDGNGIVTYGFSDAFEQPLSGDSVINSNASRQFNVQLFNADGSPKYKLINGSLVVAPNFSLTSSVVGNQYTVTATLNNPPTTPPTTVSFLVCGIYFNVNLNASKQAALTINLHKVVANQLHSIQVNASGCASGSIYIGGNNQSSYNLKAVQQVDGSILIKSTSKQEITNYYMSHTVSQSDILTDLANLIDLHSDMLRILLKQAQYTNYSSINNQLSTNEQNAITDFINNYIPKIRLKLADEAPIGTTPQNPRYPSILNHKSQANTSADEYLQVISDPDVK